MKRTLLILLSVVFIGISCEPDGPEAFEQEATLKIENTSTSHYITGVYYSTVGYGNNRISSNIGPGESKSFTISAKLKEDNLYDIKVTCDNPDIGDYTADHREFHWDDIYIVELTDTEWYDVYNW